MRRWFRGLRLRWLYRRRGRFIDRAFLGTLTTGDAMKLKLIEAKIDLIEMEPYAGEPARGWMLRP